MDNYLFKFFEKQDYVDEFRTGKIRLMSAFHYANMECSAKLYNNRADSTEGKTLVFNNNNTNPDEKKTLMFGNNEKIVLAPGVTRMVLNSGNPNQQLKISCYYVIDATDIPDNRFKTALDTMEDSLGEYYVAFTNPEEFANRIKKRLDKLIAEGKASDFSMNRVQYIDMDKIARFKNPFEKPKGLEWQHEYRLLINTVDKSDPFYIDIGDIKDITIWGHKADLEKGYVSDDTTIYIPNHKA